MKFIIALILFCILFCMCWPLALVLFFLLLFFWLILLPFSILGFTLTLVLKVASAILLFPFKILSAL